MIHKEYYIIAAILFLAFAGISINKYLWPKANGKNTNAKSLHNSSQTFWEYYNRATKLRLTNKTDSALIAYKKALKLNPRHKDALYYIGTMYKKVDKFNSARKVWQKLIGINPQSERAYNQMGNLFFCVQNKKFFKPEKSKRYFMRAENLNQQALHPKIRLGEIAVYQKRNDEAHGILNNLLMNQHKNAEIFFLLGYLDWESHNTHKALKALENTFEHASDLHLTADENGGEASSAKKVASRKSTGCDLSMNWLKKHLRKYRKLNIRVATPKIYQAFDQYLNSIRRDMEHQ
ncbi:MAG TPA: tetratricopeptide repeat protein [Balneolaceae bacterium]|nr:tetratricopeptide repeat protein [Balneolaceae bacterium]